MSLLIALLFLVLGFPYTLFLHDRDYSLAPYISGIVTGIFALPFAMMLKYEFYTSSSCSIFSFSYFLFYFLLSSFFGLLLYFIFNIKSFEPKTMPVALWGIWSVFFFFAPYEFSKVPGNDLYLIFILNYLASLLCIDVIVTLFARLPKWLILFLGYPLSMGISYLLSFNFPLWLYKKSSFLYIGTPSILIFLFLLVMILARISKRKEEVESLFEAGI